MQAFACRATGARPPTQDMIAVIDNHRDKHGVEPLKAPLVRAHSPGSTRRLTVGADKGYDSANFVKGMRQACVTPHVAQKARHSAIDGRTTRHADYALSQKRRKKIEEPFGWAKTVGPMAQTMLRGVKRVGARFALHDGSLQPCPAAEVAGSKRPQAKTERNPRGDKPYPGPHKPCLPMPDLVHPRQRHARSAPKSAAC